MAVEHFDVIIVGAGLSGIGAGYHLQTEAPQKSYAILEGRDAIGGTWDLFRYPGIRSDSDMFTLGYAFKPWGEAKAIADGPSIRKYVVDTAIDNGIERASRLLNMSIDEIRNRATISGAVEIGRVPGLVQINLLAPRSDQIRHAEPVPIGK